MDRWSHVHCQVCGEPIYNSPGLEPKIGLDTWMLEVEKDQWLYVCMDCRKTNDLTTLRIVESNKDIS